MPELIYEVDKRVIVRAWIDNRPRSRLAIIRKLKKDAGLNKLRAQLIHESADQNLYKVFRRKGEYITINFED